MNFIKAVWSWLTGWFKSEPESTPTVDKPAPKQTAPKPGTPQPVSDADKFDPPAGEETIADPVELSRQAIVVNAEEYELDGWKFKADIQGGEHYVKAALTAMEWAPIVSKYSDDTLDLIRERGTNMHLSNDIAKAITSAVQTEWGIRNPGRAPANHGMGQ